MFALISKPDPRSRASLVLDGSYSSRSSNSSPPRLPRARPEKSKSPRSRPSPNRPRGARSNTSKSPSSHDAYELLVPVDDDALARAFSFRMGARVDNGRMTTTRVVARATPRATPRAGARARCRDADNIVVARAVDMTRHASQSRVGSARVAESARTTSPDDGARRDDREEPWNRDRVHRARRR